MRLSWCLVTVALAGCAPSAPPVAKAPREQPPSPPLPKDTLTVARELLREAQHVAASGAEAAGAFERALAAWETHAKATALLIDATSWSKPPAPQDIPVSASTSDGAWIVRSDGGVLNVFKEPAWDKQALVEAHQDPILAIVIPEGTHSVFTSGADGTLRKWNLDRAELEKEVLAAGIHHLALSPNGRTIAYSCGGSLCFWDVSSPGPAERRLLTPENCRSVRGWLDDTTIVAGEDGAELCYLDVGNGEVKKTLPFISGALSFARGSKVFVETNLFGANPRMDVWDLQRADRVRTLNLVPPDRTGPVRVLWPPTLSKDGEHAAAPTAAGDITIWNVSSGKIERQIPARFPVRQATYLEDGRLLAASTESKSFDIIGDGATQTAPGFEAPALGYASFAFSSDGRSLARGLGATVQLWSMTDGTVELEARIDAKPGERILSERLSPDGRKIAVLTSLAAYVYSGGSPLQLLPPEGSNITAVAFDATGSQLIATSSNIGAGAAARGQISWSSLATESSRVAVPFTAHLGAQLSDDGAIAATATPGKGVQLWDSRTGKLRRNIDVAGRWALSPDAASVAYVGPPAVKGAMQPGLQLVATSTGRETSIADVSQPVGTPVWQDAQTLFVTTASEQEDKLDLVAVDARAAKALWRRAGAVQSRPFNLVASAEGVLLVRYRDGEVDVQRPPGVSVATWRFAEDERSWAVQADNKVDVGGPAGDRFYECSIGPWILPLRLCASRFQRKGLLAEVLTAGAK